MTNAISKPIPKGSGSNERQISQRAPIGIEKPEVKELDELESTSFDLYTNPLSDFSLTRTVKVQAFREGTVEEWFIFLRTVKEIISGQAIENNAGKIGLMRSLLRGQPLSVFNAEAAKKFKEELEDDETFFDTCVQAVTDYVLPKNALKNQRRYMRRVCRKPPHMTMKAYVARFRELNSYLAMFNNNGEANMLSEEEVVENLEFGIPNSWEKAMILQGFVPSDKSVDEIVDFCERLEAHEVGKATLSDILHAKRNAKSEPGETQSSKRKRANSRLSKRSGEDRAANHRYECMLHGPNNTHETKDCKVLKAHAESQKAVRAANSGRGKTYKNKTWNRSDNDKNSKSVNEMHAIWDKWLDEKMKKAEKAKSGKKKTRFDLDNFNYDLNRLKKNMDDLSINSESSDE